jgi:hypothetical protein
MYVPSFIKIGSGVQKLIGGGIHRHTHTHTQTATRSHKPTIFFENEEGRLKMIKTRDRTGQKPKQ